MKKKVKARKMFVQPIHPYRHELLVCAGMSMKEVVKKVDDKECADWIRKGEYMFQNIESKKQAGYTAFHQDKGYIMVLLQPVNDKWEYWECLIHELSHVVDDISSMKMLQEEGEARAYLQEWLFREIRRKLTGIEKS